MIQKLLGQQKKIILFDGACNLCDRWVQTLLKNDPHDTFRFASLQSDIGREIQNTYGIDTQQIDSIIVIDGYLGYKTKTAALFSILSDMGGLWPLLQIFWIIPKFLRDWGYDYIARHRYQWFGQKTCLVMTGDIRHKFIN